MPDKKKSPSEDQEQNVPVTYDQMVNEITNKYGVLSKRLKQIASYILDNPNDTAIDTIAVLAQKADVQPSALIRFAQAFGFSGFSDIQRLYQQRLIDANPSYSDRLASVSTDERNNSYKLLNHFVQANTLALEHLLHEIDPYKLMEAIEILKKASIIHVMGLRRSFPLASYFYYAVATMGKRVCFIDNVGGLSSEQKLNIASDDALLAISFVSYSPQTINAAEHCIKNDVSVVALTDHILSPLTNHSTVCFHVEDSAVYGFRSLSASMCLIQTLAISLGVEGNNS